MKRLLVPGVLLLVLAISVISALLWWRENTKPVSGDNTQLRFVIPKGRGASQIAEMLYEKGLIRSPLAFKIYVQTRNLSKSIQAGEFQLSKGMSLSEVVQTFLKGPLELWVTVPEGLRREEVVERFITGLEMGSSQAETFRMEFIRESEDKEGKLFPDTYLLPKDVSASKVVEILTQAFQKKLNEAIGDKKVENGLSLDQTIVLASLIERESKKNEERPVVAGILLNRLEIGMGLQVDATVQYVRANSKIKNQKSKIDNWWEPVTREDLEINSPYNTYKYSGLPPAPIANPGLSSLKAAIFPEDSDYLYYLHDSNEEIHYARTLEEHNANVRKYLGK